MATKAHGKNSAETVLASLSPDALDKLADLIIAKLTAKERGVLLPYARCRGFESHHPLHLKLYF